MSEQIENEPTLNDRFPSSESKKDKAMQEAAHHLTVAQAWLAWARGETEGVEL